MFGIGEIKPLDSILTLTNMVMEFNDLFVITYVLQMN